MAAKNGYQPKQSSSLYVTDGDEIDWAYGRHRIFMYTFELYPSHARVSSISRFYQPDEILPRETERNRSAILELISRAGCVYSILGKTKTHCGPFFDDFEGSTGWARNPYGTDTATAGRWERANPQGTTYQANTTPTGSRALVTGYRAGAGPQSYDVDGGTTTIRSAPIALPDPVGYLVFRYYFAHGTNSSSADAFRAYVEDEAGTLTLVKEERGAANLDRPSWSAVYVPLTRWAGQTIRVVFRATDGGPYSTVEAAVDDVRVQRP
jgi:hypothetical protein